MRYEHPTHVPADMIKGRGLGGIKLICPWCPDNLAVCVLPGKVVVAFTSTLCITLYR